MGGNFSKEIYYKFLASSLLPQYDKVIITDVDVVFLDDISKDFLEFDVDEPYYLAGVSCIGVSSKESFLRQFRNRYDKDFSSEERELLQIAGGYYIFNCKKMREDNLEEKFIQFAYENCNRVLQPEQDAINICCGRQKKALHPRALICSYLYDLYKDESDYALDLRYDAQTVKYSLENPIQLHYATTNKPWAEICPKQEIWFYYLAKTNFFTEYMKWLMPENRKELLKFNLLGRTFTLTKEHTKRKS